MDVGANIGIYAMLAKRWVGSKGIVICIEPNPVFVSLLEESFRSDPNIIIVPKAASNREGKSVLYISEDKPITIDKTLYDNNKEFQIEVIKIDNFIKHNSLSIPSIVKMDVEGMELAVMQGMENIFKSEYPPVVAFEYIELFAKLFDSSLPLIIDYIQTISMRGYCFYRIDYDGKLRSKDIHIATAQNDLIAIPKWRLESIDQSLFI